MTAWDESSFEAHWKNRNPNQPFFAIFNLDNTHESMIWRKAKDSLLVDSLLEVPVPPYLPDTETAKKDIRRLYSNIVEMDNRVGDLLTELEKQDLLDNTIIFWYTDHGGPLPRQKRTIYQSGLHLPLIIRFPEKQFAGQTDDQLLSFIDLKPTVLSILGQKPPSYVDGEAWLGPYAKKVASSYVFAAADRFDHQTDKIRAVFDGRYKLIRNYHPDQSYYLPVRYRETMPIMKELLRLREENKLSDEQRLWFRPTKDSIELFDLQNDPYEFKNLANESELQSKLIELKNALHKWIMETGDRGMITEEDYMQSIWPNGIQPETQAPQISTEANEITLSCTTTGASIGYQWVKNEDKLTDRWDVYTGPFEVKNGFQLITRAHRIGFRPSEVVEQKF
jgi:arylsulfatase A-like enzyme